jgi:hypothetical protein
MIHPTNMLLLCARLASLLTYGEKLFWISRLSDSAENLLCGEFSRHDDMPRCDAGNFQQIFI